MAVVAISDSILTNIADAIRSKNGTENTYKPSQMPDAIEAISGGGITPTGTIEITQNGVVDVTNYASADVDVPTGSTPVINSLSVTENGTYTAPTGVDGYSPITVNVPQGPTPTGTKQISISQNGTTTEDVTNYANAEITVNVSGGGSSLLTKLTEITVAQDARSVSIPTTDWFAYDFLVFKYDLAFSASDYLYASKADTSGGIYSNTSISAYNYVGEAYKKNSDMVVYMPDFKSNDNRIAISSGDSFYLYMYTSSKRIATNSKIIVYGGYKSNL